MASGSVELARLCKRFGDTVAVDGIDLDIAGGEFFSLLGPSGCGKTTTLRMVAGFEQPTSGSICIDGVDVAFTPPHRRPVNTVFQSYALFPLMTVAENVAFGLAYAHVARAEAQQRVRRALELVRLGAYEKRRPAQLSGGQQQRVALARALVLNPKVLLLDEPLGALDAKLRKTLQIELKSLQEQVGVTFIYVTHDQEEALTMSDRLAVMADGHVEQVGTPAEVYEDPATSYVADFLGLANLMDGVIASPGANGTCRVRVGDVELTARRTAMSGAGATKLVIRPERVRIREQGTTGENCVPAMVERIVFLGATRQLGVRLAGAGSIQAMVPNTGDDLPYTQGQPVVAELPADALRVLPERTPPHDPDAADDGSAG